MTTLQTINASASPEVVINENFIATSPAGLYGRKASTTAGLTWGYYGGIFPGSFGVIADGTKTLTNTATNYIECDTAGVVYTNTSAFTAERYRLYSVVCAGGVQTGYTDYRTPVGINTPTLTGDQTWTGDNTFAIGAITTSKPLAATQTWNAGGVTFDAQTITITDTASAAASRFINYLVGAASKFSVDKSGSVTMAGATLATSATTVTAFAGATTLLTLGGTGATSVVAIPGTLAQSGTTGAFTVGGGIYAGGAIKSAAGISGTTGAFSGTITANTATNALLTNAESWIGPSSTTGIYFKSGNVGIGTTNPQTKLGLVSGSAISFEASAGVTDIALTHTADTLTLTGGNLTLGSNSLTAGAISGTTGTFNSGATLNTATFNSTMGTWIGIQNGGANFGFIGDASTIVNGTTGDLAIRSDGTNLDFGISSALKMRLTSTGLAVTGTLSATGAMIMSTTATPTGTGAGVVGQMAWDTSYFYVCTASNDWRRIALVDF